MKATNSFLSSLNNRFRRFFKQPSEIEAEAKEYIDEYLAEVVYTKAAVVEATEFVNEFYENGKLDKQVLRDTLTVETSRGNATHPLLKLIEYSMKDRPLPTLAQLEEYAEERREAKAAGLSLSAPFSNHELYPELMEICMLLSRANRKAIFAKKARAAYTSLERTSHQRMAVHKSAMLEGALAWLEEFAEEIEEKISSIDRQGCQVLLNKIDNEERDAFLGRPSLEKRMIGAAGKMSMLIH